jgi:hypothetical protein
MVFCEKILTGLCEEGIGMPKGSVVYLIIL